MAKPTKSPFKGLVYYLRPMPSVREDAPYQYDIMWISEVEDGATPTEEEIIANAPAGARGAVYAYHTYN